MTYLRKIIEFRNIIETAGLETYFFSNSQIFVSGFNLNSQIAVSNSQLVLNNCKHCLVKWL